MNTLLARIFTKPFLVTILRYGLNALGVWLAAEGRFDPGAWETISGAVLVIATTLMGGAESVKDKAVVDGKAVDLSKLPQSVRSPLEASVPVTKGRSIFDMLLGK